MQNTKKKIHVFDKLEPTLILFFYLLHLSIPFSFSLTWTTKEKKTKKGENLLPRGTKNQAPSSLLLNKNANLSFILFFFSCFPSWPMVANPIASLLSPCKMVQKQGSKNYFPSPLSPWPKLKPSTQVLLSSLDSRVANHSHVFFRLFL